MSLSIRGGRKTVMEAECMDCHQTKPIITFMLNEKEVDVCMECWATQEKRG